MVDEPRGSARPNDADQAVRPASQYEAEWRDGLSRLMSNLETELGRAVETARRQASDAVRGIELQGLDLLTSLDERQQTAEAERDALDERLVQLQATIEATEQEFATRRRRGDGRVRGELRAAPRSESASRLEAEQTRCRRDAPARPTP